MCVLYDSNKFHVRYSALNTLSTRLAQILGTPVYARLRDIAAETLGVHLLGPKNGLWSLVSSCRELL